MLPILPVVSFLSVLIPSARADAPEAEACVRAYVAEGVDDYSAGHLCDTPEERAARAPISRCVRSLTDAGYEYGNKYDVCATNRGFGSELPAFLRCYRAEAIARDGDDMTTPLNQCAVAEFRNNRALVNDCIQTSLLHWTPTERAALGRALFPICADPSARASIPEVASCSRTLSTAPLPAWDTESQDLVGAIERCTRPEVRSGLDATIACRRTVIAEVNEALAARGALANLTAPEGQEDDSRSQVDRDQLRSYVRSLLDQCATDTGFRGEASPRIRCSNDVVRAWGGIPFVTDREMNRSMLSYSSRVYETSLALDRCATASDREFQGRVLACARIAERPEVVALRPILPERSDDTRILVYSWCTLQVVHTDQTAAGVPCP